MPYIKQEDRSALEPFLEDLLDGLGHDNTEETLKFTPGVLNYIVTKLAFKYRDVHGENYQTYNDIAGALANANLEFYIRQARPYEDLKILDNGEV